MYGFISHAGDSQLGERRSQVVPHMFAVDLLKVCDGSSTRVWSLGSSPSGKTVNVNDYQLVQPLVGN